MEQLSITKTLFVQRNKQKLPSFTTSPVMTNIYNLSQQSMSVRTKQGKSVSAAPQALITAP